MKRFLGAVYPFCLAILLAFWAVDGSGSVFFPTVLSLLYLIVGCFRILLVLTREV